MRDQRNPDFLNHLGKRKLVQKIRRLEKSKVLCKFHLSFCQGSKMIRRFRKFKGLKIRIPLYFYNSLDGLLAHCKLPCNILSVHWCSFTLLGEKRHCECKCHAQEHKMMMLESNTLSIGSLCLPLHFRLTIRSHE